MTSITRPVKRETAALYRGRPLMVELRPWGVILREKGRRLAVSVEYRAVYELGFKMMARAAASARLAGRPVMKRNDGRFAKGQQA